MHICSYVHYFIEEIKANKTPLFVDLNFIKEEELKY